MADVLFAHKAQNKFSIGDRQFWMSEATRDASVRWFHWINVLCVLFMAGTGLFILYDDPFGIEGEGKVMLKTVHSIGGYVFVTNLLWRLIWAFIGSPNARWRALLPGGSGYLVEVRQEIRQFRKHHFVATVDHTALGRLMITVLLLLLVTQAVTGLVLAGADVYLPPFGGYFANWVTAGDATLLESLRPGSTEFVVESAWAEMRGFRSPFKEVHEYIFYILLVAVIVHVSANVVAEVRSATGQISSMFSGRIPSGVQKENSIDV